MSGIVDNPFVVSATFLVAQWIAAYLGDFVRSRQQPAKKDELADLDIVQTAILTLLALIVDFSFSMAVSRYDQRKNYEEAEAECDRHRISARESVARRKRAGRSRPDPAMA